MRPAHIATAMAAIATTITATGAWPRAAAQAPPAAAKPAFEVAAVKLNKSGDGNVRINIQPGGRFVATNVALRLLIRTAYQLQDFQMVGGPDWLGSDRFDITAKAETDFPPSPPGTLGPMNFMMQSLLEDRFKLVVHRETREMPIYALVVARSDARLGPKLTASTVDCQAMMTASIGRGAPPPANAANGRPVCGMRIGPGTMLGGGFPLSQLASALSQTVQRTVIDHTGLTGNFDLELGYTPDQLPQGGPRDGPGNVDPNGPSIFTALQEQLGLKLESQRGPVDVLVIDRAERPTED